MMPDQIPDRQIDRQSAGVCCPESVAVVLNANCAVAMQFATLQGVCAALCGLRFIFKLNFCVLRFVIKANTRDYLFIYLFIRDAQLILALIITLPRPPHTGTRKWALDQLACIKYLP